MLEKGMQCRRLQKSYSCSKYVAELYKKEFGFALPCCKTSALSCTVPNNISPSTPSLLASSHKLVTCTGTFLYLFAVGELPENGLHLTSRVLGCVSSFKKPLPHHAHTATPTGHHRAQRTYVGITSEILLSSLTTCGTIGR